MLHSQQQKLLIFELKDCLKVKTLLFIDAFMVSVTIKCVIGAADRVDVSNRVEVWIRGTAIYQPPKFNG